MSAEFSPSQNSPLRKETAGIINSFAEKIHERFPALTADQITIAGVVGVGIASWLAEDSQNGHTGKRLASLSLMTGSTLLDALDGAIARISSRNNSGNQSNVRGQIVDTAADRVQETIMSISRAMSTASRGDEKGRILAILSGITSVVPSFTKTFAESHGRVVPEAGSTPLGFFGTRVGRAGFGIISTVYPEINGIPVQKLLDGITSGANILTSYERFGTTFKLNYDGEESSPEKVSEAKAKLKAMWVISAGVALAELIAFNKIKVKNLKTA